MAGCSVGGGVAAELCRVSEAGVAAELSGGAVRRVLPPAAGAWLRHKYIGVHSGSLVELVSKTNIFLYR